MFNRKIQVLILIVSIALSAVSCKKSGEVNSWNKAKKSGELVVGLCAMYPPFESRNEKTGEFEGFDIDLASAVAAELGLKAKIVDSEWKGLLGGLAKGDFDALVTCMSKRETANNNVNMSDVYYELQDVIVVRKDRADINKREDLNGKIIGVQLGSGSEQVVDAMKDSKFKSIKRYEYNPEAFIDLKNKRSDAVIVGYAYAVNQLKKEPGIYRVIFADLEKAEIVIIMKKGDDELTEKVNKALAAIRKNGKYDEICAKWLKVD
ncbi:MAG TPA: ABC transporter substrate-binding protein [Spirochaetota bacterium]|nr:ABC transporter substrate-binding protein [Spirochaetota bacterium]